MSRENPTEHEPQDVPAPQEATAPGKRPDEYLVQTKRVMDDWQPSKDGKSTQRSTKLVNGAIGPFRMRAIAEQVAAGMANMDSIISANVITIEDAPAPEQQVPASEDVLREMVKNGQVPGVPADATVRVEGEPQAAPAQPEAEAEPAPMPDNTVPFPSAVQPE